MKRTHLIVSIVFSLFILTACSGGGDVVPPPTFDGPAAVGPAVGPGETPESVAAKAVTLSEAELLLKAEDGLKACDTVKAASFCDLVDNFPSSPDTAKRAFFCGAVKFVDKMAELSKVVCGASPSGKDFLAEMGKMHKDYVSTQAMMIEGWKTSPWYSSSAPPPDFSGQLVPFMTYLPCAKDIAGIVYPVIVNSTRTDLVVNAIKGVKARLSAKDMNDVYKWFREFDLAPAVKYLDLALAASPEEQFTVKFGEMACVDGGSDMTINYEDKLYARAYTNIINVIANALGNYKWFDANADSDWSQDGCLTSSTFLSCFNNGALNRTTSGPFAFAPKAMQFLEDLDALVALHGPLENGALKRLLKVPLFNIMIVSQNGVSQVNQLIESYSDATKFAEMSGNIHVNLKCLLTNSPPNRTTAITSDVLKDNYPNSSFFGPFFDPCITVNGSLALSLGQYLPLLPLQNFGPAMFPGAVPPPPSGFYTSPSQPPTGEEVFPIRRR